MTTPDAGTAPADLRVHDRASIMSRLVEALTLAAPELSEASAELALGALSHALRSFPPGEGEPMAPFTIVAAEEGSAVATYPAGAAAPLAQMRADVAAPGAARGVVVWEGFVSLESSRMPAVFVEATEAGAPSVTIAQRYVRLGGVAPCGEMLFFGPGAPLL